MSITSVLQRRTSTRSRTTIGGIALAALTFFGIATASAQPNLQLAPGLLQQPQLQLQQTSRTVTIQGGGLMFLDAHETADRDFNVVLRQFQNNTSQQWVLIDQGGGLYLIQQVLNGRFLDAHEIPELDFRVVTRDRQTFDNTQLWRITDYGGGFVTIQHVNTGRFLEPYLDEAHDFQVVLRPGDGNNQQTWRLGG